MSISTTKSKRKIVALGHSVDGAACGVGVRATYPNAKRRQRDKSKLGKN